MTTIRSNYLWQNPCATLIEFDGGSTCNIPRLGYGKGYGSYRINSKKIQRIQFDAAMSANCAEILTLVSAIEDAKKIGVKDFVVIGDSQIALKWADVATGKRKATKLDNTSDGFKKAVASLCLIARGTTIETQWRPRAYSVTIFGH